MINDNDFCQKSKKDLVPYGHEIKRIKEEVLYLIKGGCIIPEHQGFDIISEDDLISISAAGIIHLELMKNADYLSTCAEDIWVDDSSIAKDISKRISSQKEQLSLKTKLKNAKNLYNYLSKKKTNSIFRPNLLLEEENEVDFHSLESLKFAISEAEKEAQKIMESIEEVKVKNS